MATLTLKVPDTNRGKLNFFLRSKELVVRQPVVKLEVFRNIVETEELLRFRIEQEEKTNG